MDYNNNIISEVVDYQESFEQKIYFNQILGKLPDVQKIIVFYFFWRGHTMLEISKMIYKSEGTVCLILHQALNRLGDQIILDDIEAGLI